MYVGKYVIHKIAGHLKIAKFVSTIGAFLYALLNLRVTDISSWRGDLFIPNADVVIGSPLFTDNPGS